MGKDKIRQKRAVPKKIKSVFEKRSVWDTPYTDYS